MRVLVSGATGFLGSALCRKLHESGETVVALLRTGGTADNLKLLIPELETVHLESLTDAGHIDMICHLATNYGKTPGGEHLVGEVNFTLPCKLLDYACAQGTRIFLNIDTPIPPETSSYAKFKRQFRNVLQSSLTPPIRLNLVLQYFYGEHEPLGRLVSSLIDSAVSGAESFPLSPGEQQRDFVHIDDVLSGITTVLDMISRTTGPADEGGWEYEIGTGTTVSLQELVGIIRDSVPDCQTNFQFGAFPYRENEIMEAVADTLRLREIGWEPKVSIEQGIRRVVQHRLQERNR
jgi:nucleoside-diphosphate-sugar epimerase